MNKRASEFVTYFVFRHKAALKMFKRSRRFLSVKKSMNLLLEIWRRAAIEWITILFVQQPDTFKKTLRSISE